MALKHVLNQELDTKFVQMSATSRKNVSSGIFDSNQPAQLQKLARLLKLWI